MPFVIITLLLLPTLYSTIFDTLLFISSLTGKVWSVHENRKPWKCKLCNSSFGFKDGLKRHTDQLHDPARPICCGLCTQRFKNHSQYSKHICLAHPGIYKGTEKDSKDVSSKASTKESGAGSSSEKKPILVSPTEWFDYPFRFFTLSVVQNRERKCMIIQKERSNEKVADYDRSYLHIE